MMYEHSCIFVNAYITLSWCVNGCDYEKVCVHGMHVSCDCGSFHVTFCMRHLWMLSACLSVSYVYEYTYVHACVPVLEVLAVK